MGMKLYWTVSEGGEKAFKTQMKNAGDTVKMREDFKEYLLKNEREYLLKNRIGEDDLNPNTLLVSKKNPFYTAKTNGVLKKIEEDGKQLFLGYFEEDRNGEPKLSRWRIAGTGVFTEGNDQNRRFFREDPTQGNNGWEKVQP